MSNLGMGVMLGILGGNEDTVNAVKSSLNKEIVSVSMNNDNLQFVFSDGVRLNIWDGGQSCCESRYMTTDDNLSDYSGSKLLNVELKTAPDQEDQYGGVHEVQFLDVTTNKGVFQVATHNEHNGYYGGFWIQANLK